MDDVYSVIAESNVRIFAVAIEKTAIEGDPYERGFEEIVNRFDRMVSRISRKGRKTPWPYRCGRSNYRNNLELLAHCEGGAPLGGDL